MRRNTSDEAYRLNIATGLICGLREKVYTALHNFPNSTANEIASLPELAVYQIDSVRPRFAELESVRIIAATGERECRITNLKVVTWALTDHTCTKEDFKKKQSRIELEEELQNLRNENTELKRLANDIYVTLSENNPDKLKPNRFEIRAEGYPGLTLKSIERSKRPDILQFYCETFGVKRDQLIFTPLISLTI